MKSLILLCLIVLAACATSRPQTNRQPQAEDQNQNKYYDCYSGFSNDSSRTVDSIHEVTSGNLTKYYINGKETDLSESNLTFTYDSSVRNGVYDIIIVGKRDYYGKVLSSGYCRLRLSERP